MNTAPARAVVRPVTVERGRDRDWRGPLARFGLVGEGVFHLVIGVSVWRLATGSGSGSEVSSTGAATARSGPTSTGSSAGGQEGAVQASDTVFDLPMGRWLVFAIGAGIMALAVYLAVAHAVDGRFLQRLRVGERSAAARIGRVGYGLRSVAFLLVGYFFADAGLSYDPQQAEGLSGSLRKVADEPWGPEVLVAVAVGFVTYGVYCFFESALRRAA